MNGKSHWKKSFKDISILAVFVTALFVMPFANATDKKKADTPEKEFRQSLSALLENRAELSLEHIQNLLKRHRNFQLGQLIYADLLVAQAHQNTLMASPATLEKVRIRGLLEEAQARIHYRKPPSEYLPNAIMQLSPLHKYAFVLDASRARLYLFLNNKGVPKIIFDRYTSIGNGGVGKSKRGDKKTPLGVYHLASHISDNELPELYGAGAYPINYPNKWDQLKSRSGFGIWLHGTPRRVYSRPPQDSRGCIVINNQLIADLSSYIDIGHTPIILASKIEWLAPDAWQTMRKELLNAIQQWRQDWQSLDVDQYLSHYSPKYQAFKENYQEMTTTTRRNAKKKTFVEVTIENLDLFNYPGEKNTIIAVFDQNYRSNNYNIHYRKQQFWRYENSRWVIIFENRAETTPFT